jgi:two-component system LytT family response regulator
MRVLIVDDERIARNRLRALLEAEPDVEIMGECANGHEAIDALSGTDPDVVFIDIQMPGADGLAVVRSIPAEKAPLIVFVTAYDKYALEAFEVRAFDYLLKPFDRERFQRTLANVRTEMSRGRKPNPARRLASLIDTLESRPKLERLAIRNKGHVTFLRAESIDWIEAADNYVCLHCGGTTHVMRETMNALEKRLDSSRFVRIHRSTIVNADRIRELQPWFRGDYRVILHDGTALTLSRTYRQSVEVRLLGV